MNRTALATVTGLILGLALVFGSFGDMLIVALLGAIGYGIAKVLDGDWDVQGWLSRGRGRGAPGQTSTRQPGPAVMSWERSASPMVSCLRSPPGLRPRTPTPELRRLACWAARSRARVTSACAAPTCKRCRRHPWTSMVPRPS